MTAYFPVVSRTLATEQLEHTRGALPAAHGGLPAEQHELQQRRQQEKPEAAEAAAAAIKVKYARSVRLGNRLQSAVD